MRLKCFFLYISILSFCCILGEVKSVSALTVDQSCKVVESVFVRGSGGKIGEGESNVFFKQFESRIVSEKITRSGYELGTEEYGGHKYQAVQVDKAPYGNAIGAKISNGKSNDYGKSVDSGVGELYNYLTQRYKKCKSSGTKFALAGYSQGAQVVGQTLPKFTTELRKSIIYAAFFGDPKLHLPEGEGLNGLTPACWGFNLSPYREVIANCNVDNGSLGARKPYLPDDMKMKSGLWCYDHDYVCGVTRNIFDNDGHTKYKNSGMAIDQAAQKIAERLEVALPEVLPILMPSLPVAEYGALIDASYRMGSGTTGQNVAFIVDVHPSMVSRISQIKDFIRREAPKIVAEGGKFSISDSRAIYNTQVRTTFRGSQFGLDTQQVLNVLDDLYTPSRIADFPSHLETIYKVSLSLEWDKGATKSIILFTNNSTVESPDRSGITIEDVAKLALTIDPVNIYPVVPTDSVEGFKYLAEQTSGQVIEDEGDTQLAAGKALAKIKQRPVPFLKNTEYRAHPGQEVTFDASDSYVIGAQITKYDWDFDGDGVFEQSTDTPIARHTYTQKFDGWMQVRTTASNDMIANMSAKVQIGTYVAPVLPKVPTNVTSQIVSTKDGVSTVKFSWKAADALAANWAISMDGVTLGLAPVGQNTIEISDVIRDKDVEFSVAGVMTDGAIGDPGTAIVAKEVVAPPQQQPTWWQAIVDCIKKIVQPIIKFPWW